VRSLLADLTAAAAHLTRSLAATAAPESAAKRGVDAGAEETQPKRAKKAQDDAEAAVDVEAAAVDVEAAAVDVEAAAVDADEEPALDPPEVAAAPTRRRDGRRAPIDLAAFEAFRRERDA
jgi:hypothetical protein